MNGLDEASPAIELAADRFDVSIDRPSLDRAICSFAPIGKLLARENIAWATRQLPQQLELCWSQSNWSVLHSHAMLVAV